VPCKVSALMLLPVLGLALVGRVAAPAMNQFFDG